MAATDDYVNLQPYPQLGSVRAGEAVTPSDSVALGRVSRALWVGGTGAVAVITAEGSTLTLSGVPTGTWLWIAASQVKATGTTATSIVALY